MTTILRLDSSVRGEQSLTKKLTQDFVSEWKNAFPNDLVIAHDFSQNPPPVTGGDWVTASFTRPEKRTAEQQQLMALSDQFIEELKRADIIVMGAPVYNYGMPATLKIWFDHVIRIGQTFSFDLARGDFPLEPIFSNKKLVILSARGEFGYEPGGIRSHMNHLEEQIRTCSHYLGVSEIHSISIDYQEFGGERHENSIKNAHHAVKKLVAELVMQV